MPRFVEKWSGIKRGIRQFGQARVPWLVIAILLAIQAAIEFYGGYPNLRKNFELFGLSRANFAPWQLITYALLHGNWVHVVTNCACLLMLGTRIEHVLGKLVFVKVLLLGILGGGVGYLALGVSEVVLVGSSSATFALLILSTTLAPDSIMWPAMISGRLVGGALLVGSALLALMDPAIGIPGFSGVGEWLSRRGFESWWMVGHGCHFGGGLVGWLYGKWLLRPRVTREWLRRDREKREQNARIQPKKRPAPLEEERVD
jgi:membrane associated rhomboid family serine protease